MLTKNTHVIICKFYFKNNADYKHEEYLYELCINCFNEYKTYRLAYRAKPNLGLIFLGTRFTNNIWLKNTIKK